MAEPDDRNYLDERKEFHEARAKGIGATDSPKILGLSRRGTALSVYNDKMGLTPQGEMSLPAWLGLRMETLVGELYTQATGNKLRADNVQHVHPKYDWLRCHLDFRVLGNPKVLVECKTRAYQRGWGEDGTTEVPPDIFGQVQHEMAVTGAERCDVAVLFGHHAYHTYPIPRNDQFIETMLPPLERFWNDNYLAGVPPPPGGSLDTDNVKRTYAEHDDTIKSATPAQAALVQTVLLARHNVHQASEFFAEWENKLKALIDTAAGITGPFGTVTWKRSQDRVVQDWEAIAGTYVHVIEDLLALANPGDDDEAVRRLARAQSTYEAAYTLFSTVKPGTRRMNYQITEEEA